MINVNKLASSLPSTGAMGVILILLVSIVNNIPDAVCGAGDNITDVQSVKMIYLPRFTHLLPFVPFIIPSLHQHFITVGDNRTETFFIIFGKISLWVPKWNRHGCALNLDCSAAHQTLKTWYNIREHSHITWHKHTIWMVVENITYMSLQVS